MSDRLKEHLATFLLVALVGGMLLYGIHIMASCQKHEYEYDQAIEQKVDRALKKKGFKPSF